MNSLVSVVVPVYNVEQYLDNCISSILNQTYTNLEIIMVNDGSTDSSGDKCDYFAQIDKRIKVIHKENGGLSDARNTGIDIAKGKYITFIDSDDYYSKDAIEYLVALSENNNSQVSIGNLKKTNILNDSYQEARDNVELFNNYESIREMLYANKYSTAAPVKLYLTELFDGIRYPLGKFSEDLYITYKLLEKANRVVYGSKTIYYYYRRPGSITASGFSKRQLDVIEALNNLKKDINLEKNELLQAYASQMIEDIMSMLERKPRSKEIISLGLWDLVKKYRKIVLFDAKACKRVRAYALLSYMGTWSSICIMSLYYQRKWNN